MDQFQRSQKLQAPALPGPGNHLVLILKIPGIEPVNEFSLDQIVKRAVCQLFEIGF